MEKKRRERLNERTKERGDDGRCRLITAAEERQQEKKKKKKKNTRRNKKSSRQSRFFPRNKQEESEGRQLFPLRRRLQLREFMFTTWQQKESRASPHFSFAD